MSHGLNAEQKLYIKATFGGNAFDLEVKVNLPDALKLAHLQLTLNQENSQKVEY